MAKADELGFAIKLLGISSKTAVSIRPTLLACVGAVAVVLVAVVAVAVAVVVAVAAVVVVPYAADYPRSPRFALSPVNALPHICPLPSHVASRHTNVARLSPPFGTVQVANID